MPTGLPVLMIDEALMDSVFTLEPILYHGHLPSNELSLKVVSNLNIEAWYLYLLNIYGFKLSCMSLVCQFQLLLFGVTIRVLRT